MVNAAAEHLNADIMAQCCRHNFHLLITVMLEAASLALTLVLVLLQLQLEMVLSSNVTTVFAFNGFAPLMYMGVCKLVSIVRRDVCPVKHHQRSPQARGQAILDAPCRGVWWGRGGLGRG